MSRPPHTRGWRRAGNALVAALVALALAGLTAASLATVARQSMVRARLTRDAARARLLTGTALAQALVDLGLDHGFDAALAEAPRSGGRPPWVYERRLIDDADDDPSDPSVDTNGRVFLTITARGPGIIERRLQAIIRRDPTRTFPAAVILLGGVRNLTRDFRIDGRNSTQESDCAVYGIGEEIRGLGLADGVTPPLVEDPDQIAGRGTRPSIGYVWPPDLHALRTDPAAERRSAGTLDGLIGTSAAPRFTIVDGDALADGVHTGVGLLYVDGRVRVTGTLAFSGVLAAARGIEVAAGGTLRVCGALWADGDPALDVLGSGTVHRSTEAIHDAGRVAPIARADVVAMRELH